MVPFLDSPQICYKWREVLLASFHVFHKYYVLTVETFHGDTVCIMEFRMAIYSMELPRLAKLLHDYLLLYLQKEENVQAMR